MLACSCPIAGFAARLSPRASVRVPSADSPASAAAQYACKASSLQTNCLLHFAKSYSVRNWYYKRGERLTSQRLGRRPRACQDGVIHDYDNSNRNSERLHQNTCHRHCRRLSATARHAVSRANSTYLRPCPSIMACCAVTTNSLPNLAGCSQGCSTLATDIMTECIFSLASKCIPSKCIFANPCPQM